MNGFSLGMRKRLALAMALLHAPRLLLLDEPTSGLDPRGVAALRELLRQRNQDGLTIFLSSHVLGEMQQLCTHVAILNRGQLVLQDEVEAVRATVREAGLRATLRVGGFEPEQLDDIAALPSVHEVRAVPDGRHTRLEIRRYTVLELEWLSAQYPGAEYRLAGNASQQVYTYHTTSLQLEPANGALNYTANVTGRVIDGASRYEYILECHRKLRPRLALPGR